MEELFLFVMFVMTFAYTAAVCINICLCHDLMYCLRNPMQNPEARYPYYAALITIVSFTTGMIRVHYWDEAIYGDIILGIFIVYLGVAIGSIVFALRYVNKPGIS